MSMLPEDPDCPLVCMDEASKQLVGETRTPLPARPGESAHEDYEYVRNGVANLFMFFAPLQGWRHVAVTERRTKVDCAHALRDLVDVHFPMAPKVRVVFDNLNTHAAGSLYEAFPPEEARRILDRLELHHTPKHGSWLHMAAIELSVLARQCLDRRLPDQAMLTREIAAWEAPRNSAQATMDWRFTTADARITLTHLYPVTTQICDHEQFVKGPGCVKYINIEAGGLLRVLLDRDSAAYKDIYRQRTSAERINAQAKALGIEGQGPQCALRPQPQHANLHCHHRAGPRPCASDQRPRRDADRHVMLKPTLSREIDVVRATTHLLLYHNYHFSDRLISTAPHKRGKELAHMCKVICRPAITVLMASPDFRTLSLWRYTKGTRGPKPIVRGTLVLVEVERLPRQTRKPKHLWLWWRGPEGSTADVALLWRAYVRRFDQEHTFRFCKQILTWPTLRVRDPEQADRWTWLVLLAYTQLRLARSVVADQHLPWERRLDTRPLTPYRVRRAFCTVLPLVGTPAKPPKPCGRSPGRPKGARSGLAPRYPAIKTAA